MNDSEILDLGFKLEAAGLSHSEIDSYLEHHGVKGMKWGQRRRAAKAVVTTKAPKGDFKSRSLTQKGALVVGAGAGWVATRKVMEHALGTKAPLAQLVISGAGSVAAARTTRHLLDKHVNTKMSDVSMED